MHRRFEAWPGAASVIGSRQESAGARGWQPLLAGEAAAPARAAIDAIAASLTGSLPARGDPMVAPEARHVALESGQGGLALFYAYLARSTDDRAAMREAHSLLASALDVRAPAEVEALHIPGSYNVPLDQISEHRKEFHGVGEPIVLVCRSGTRARQAEALLSSANVPRLHVLDGGMVAWNRAGFAVSRGRQVWSIERQVRAIAGALVLIGVLGSLLLWQPLIYLGLLVGAGLLFAGLTDTCTMGLLLTRLPFNRGAPVTSPACSLVSRTVRTARCRHVLTTVGQRGGPGCPGPPRCSVQRATALFACYCPCQRGPKPGAMPGPCRPGPIPDPMAGPKSGPPIMPAPN